MLAVVVGHLLLVGPLDGAVLWVVSGCGLGLRDLLVRGAGLALLSQRMGKRVWGRVRVWGLEIGTAIGLLHWPSPHLGTYALQAPHCFLLPVARSGLVRDHHSL